MILRALGGGLQLFSEPLAGVYKSVITRPLQTVFAELCVILCVAWAGPLLTGLDTPIKGPSDYGARLECRRLDRSSYIYIYIYVCIMHLSLSLYIYIYIYIGSARRAPAPGLASSSAPARQTFESDRATQNWRRSSLQGRNHIYIYIYIYVYIYIYIYIINDIFIYLYLYLYLSLSLYIYIFIYLLHI